MRAALTRRKRVIVALSIVLVVMIGAVGAGLHVRRGAQPATSTKPAGSEETPPTSAPVQKAEAPAGTTRAEADADPARVLPGTSDRSGPDIANVGDRDVPLLQAVVCAPKSEDISILGAVATVNGTGARFGIPKLELWCDTNGDGQVQRDQDQPIADIDGARIPRPGTAPYHSTQTFSARASAAPTVPAGASVNVLFAVSEIGPLNSPEPDSAKAAPPRGDAPAKGPSATDTIRVPPRPRGNARAPLAVGLIVALALAVPRRRAALLPLLIAAALALPACELSAPPGPGPTLQVVLTGVRMHGATTGRDYSAMTLSIPGPTIAVREK